MRVGGGGLRASAAHAEDLVDEASAASGADAAVSVAVGDVAVRT